MPLRRPLLASFVVLVVAVLPLSACSSGSSQTAQPDKFCPMVKKFTQKPSTIKRLKSAKENPYDATYFPEWAALVTQTKPYLPSNLLVHAKTVLDFSAVAKKNQYAMGTKDNFATDRTKTNDYLNATLRLVEYMSTACHLPLPSQ